MRVHSGGESVALHSDLAWAASLAARATGDPVQASAATAPTVTVHIESKRDPFSLTGLRTVTRGAYSDGRTTVLHNACGSGFDLSVHVDEQLTVIARYRPVAPLRVANRMLARRFGLLAGQVLVHYPVLWRAGWRGRVPLHASAVSLDAGVPLIVGPGGVGKSTLLVRALADGAVATSDNLCCADATTCFGIAEPVRTDTAGAAPGHRTSHNRTESPFTGRVPELVPDQLVVLERGPRTQITPIAPEYAARALTAGTYAAGELRRYWAFAATLALATGLGPAHPPIAEVATAYTTRVPCRRVCVGDGDTVAITDVCGAQVRS